MLLCRLWQEGATPPDVAERLRENEKAREIQRRAWARRREQQQKELDQQARERERQRLESEWAREQEERDSERQQEVRRTGRDARPMLVNSPEFARAVRKVLGMRKRIS